MKVKLIKSSPIDTSDIETYKLKTSKLKGVVFNSNDVDMDKRIISVRLVDDNDLVLVNPIVLKQSDTPIVYYERDTYKPTKVRKTIRHSYLLIDTDNLGKVEFKPTTEGGKWKTGNEFMEDAGLLECVLVQRAIDAINGIDITHPAVVYKEQRSITKSPGRNERVMLQSPSDETIFIKYKKADEYLSKGYRILQ
jgi:hypothetical protein